MNYRCGQFYFLSDRYINKFPDEKLMQNKEVINGMAHNRPCFFAFKDSNTGIMWMIPFSSKVQKFRRYEAQKIARYGKCNTILFGRVLGREKAFLIQNMCPVTPEYIDNVYDDARNGRPVRVDGVFERKLIKTAKEVIAKERNGVRITFPNIIRIEQVLLAERIACDAC